MYVSDLALTDFRSYRQLLLAFDPGVNVLVGANAQGKTNILESIVYLAMLHSHRVNADAALVRFPDPQEEPPGGAVIRAKVMGSREKLLELEIVAGRANRARLNRAPVRPRELLGNLQVVIFSPEDLALIKGDPAGRRRLLDDLVVQLDPLVGGYLADLEQVLRQRAALLKALKAKQFGPSRYIPADTGLSAADEGSLRVWDEQLAKLAARVVAARVLLTRGLQPYLQKAYADITARTGPEAGQAEAGVVTHTQVTATYVTRVECGLQDAEKLTNTEQIVAAYEPAILQLLTVSRAEEIARGVNLFGPHRDDWELSLGGMPVKGFASHGETWSVALALRLASFWYIRQAVGSDPVLLLDDVFAELDAHRRQALAEIIAQCEQVIITGAVGTEVPVNLQAHTYLVQGSEVTKL